MKGEIIEVTTIIKDDFTIEYRTSIITQEKPKLMLGNCEVTQ